MGAAVTEHDGGNRGSALVLSLTHAAGMIASGCVGFEPYGAEVVPRGKSHVRVEGGGQAP